MDERYLPFYGGLYGGANQPWLYANLNGFGGYGAGFGRPFGCFGGHCGHGGAGGYGSFGGPGSFGGYRGSGGYGDYGGPGGYWY